MRNALRVLIVTAVMAMPAWAGIIFTQVTKSEGGRRGDEDSVMKIWSDGERAKVEWTEGSNPMFGKGSYVLVNETGEMTVVNPEKKSYSKFDMASMMESMEMGMGAAAGFGMKMEFQNVKVEKVLEEPGGDLLGYPTTHYRWHTTWTMVMKMPAPMKDRHNDTDLMEDVWTTTGISLPGAANKALAGMGQGPMMGELRKVIEASRPKMTGFPLKRVSVRKGSGMHGGGQTTTTSIVVTELTNADVPGSTFVIPSDYKEREMMQPQRGPAMPDLNQKIPDLN
ncbi:MAG: hypothetical protein U0V70_17500 [Terriglobia bacterium]